MRSGALARFGVGALALALGGGAAHAAPPGVFATVTADVDGDGTADEIRLTPDGVSVTATSAHKELTFGLAMTRGTVTAGGRWIAVQAETARGIEGVGLRYKAGALTVLWRGPIGPVGVDADYRVELIATADGLIRHHSRADVRRCDGKPALLYAEGWDEARKAFRPIRIRPAVDPAAISIKATRVTDPTPPRPVVFAAQAASTIAGVADAGGLAPPRELDDGDVASGWREDRGGDGRGEFFTFRAVVRGEGARALWYAPGGGGVTNRPSRIAVVGATSAYWVDIPDDGAAAAYRIDLPQPIAECVTVVIGEVRRGKGMAAGGGTTAIGELSVLADADLTAGGAETALVAQVMKGGAGAPGAADMLVRRGTAGASAVVSALAASGVAHDARRRLLRVLIRSHDPAGAAALAAGITADLTGPDVDDAAAALAAMGPSAIAPLSALATDGAQATDARAAAMTAIGAIQGAEATAALVAAAGGGPRKVRFAATHALGARPTGELLAVPAPASPAAEADLLRGLGLAANKATGAERTAAVARLVAGLGATDYERRYRAIQGIGGIGDDAALATLDQTLGALPAGGESSALHQVAALALARNPAGGARTILTRLAAHADPGVRLRGINALAQRDTGDAAATDQVLAGVLAADHWPELRRAAASALGPRCQRPAPAAALVTAVGADVELEVRGDALAALVACKASGIADRLIKLALDDKAPLPLRERAVTLTVALDDKRLETPLLQVFERWRSAAFDSPEALALAARAAVALGRIGGARSAAALEAALADEALPELISSVAAGLGALGPACPKSAQATLRELAHSDQQMVAMSARRAAAQCGK